MYVWKQTFVSAQGSNRLRRPTLLAINEPLERQRCLLPLEHVMRCSVQIMSASFLNRRYVFVAGMREDAWAQKNDFKGSATQYLHKYGSRTLLYRA